MQLTKHTDLALRVLIYLALYPDELHTISDIATRYGESKNHLVKVVHKLASKGYIVSVQGRGGGIKLYRPATDIVVGSVVSDIESTLSVIDCDANQCPLIPACLLKNTLREATNAFIDVLNNYTIADLTQNESQLRNLLAVPNTAA